MARMQLPFELKAADGCDNRCSYCMIPDIRGAFRSRPMRDIVAEATDLADALATKGMPFRESHALVSKVSRLSFLKRKPLSYWTLTELRKHSRLFGKDVYKVFDVRASLAKRDLPGGTGPLAQRYQLAKAKSLMRAG
jgi:argininosuccinate lyase